MSEIDADGVIGIHTSEPDVELPVDVGKVHYRKLALVGSTIGNVAASYSSNLRESIVPGGRTWFVGGAGPMGQMHVIKAVMDEQGPTDILVTDLSDERLSGLKHLLPLLGAKRKVNLTFENPKDLPAEELDTFLHEKFPGGFDDVVVLVPVSFIISQSAHYLAPNGVLNIFAGVKLGTVTDLPMAPIITGTMRLIGSSGSPLSAMRDTLALTESGRLSTSYSLAAVGDMGSAGKGMKALMDNTFTGQGRDLPVRARDRIEDDQGSRARDTGNRAASPGWPVLDTRGGSGILEESTFQIARRAKERMAWHKRRE